MCRQMGHAGGLLWQDPSLSLCMTNARESALSYPPWSSLVESRGALPPWAVGPATCATRSGVEAANLPLARSARWCSRGAGEHLRRGAAQPAAVVGERRRSAMFACMSWMSWMVQGKGPCVHSCGLLLACDQGL